MQSSKKLCIKCWEKNHGKFTSSTIATAIEGLRSCHNCGKREDGLLFDWPPIQTKESLEALQEESEKQSLPEQKRVFSISEKLRRRVHNLPDPTRPPLGYDESKAFDRVFSHLRLPQLHPVGNDDTVIFNAPDMPANQLILGDNLEVLRTLPSESIDLIYIDPPFFSGRNYNVIWGDSNEVRSFHDIWEGGIDSYLIWLNARLWEMRRVLKSTGSIYVHCDWHASHYIKTEMDKIFGYENFRNEIVWAYKTPGRSERNFKRKHDVIFYYSKTGESTFNGARVELSESTLRVWGKHFNKDGKITYGHMREHTPGWYAAMMVKGKIRNDEDVYLDLHEGAQATDWWDDIPMLNKQKERIGYPTQKPEALLERIIKASSNEGDVVADLFCGGGTTLAVAQKLKRRFIGCDSSRVAISVTMDRLIKIGEEMSGVISNISEITHEVKGKTLFSEGIKQLKLQQKTEGEKRGLGIKVSNIEVGYLGVYPVEKFKDLPHKEFVRFVLTCYGASINTAGGKAHGYKPPGQSEPILVGPSNPKYLIDPQEVKSFFNEIKTQLEPNKMVRAKIICWRFSREVLQYLALLQKYIQENNLPLEIEALPIDSKEFRRRVLLRKPELDPGEFFMRFSKAPVIGDIKVKKIGEREYEFEAVDAISTNEDGWLVNAQWDFDYQEGHFSADKEYILCREKGNDRTRGEHFVAILKAHHGFVKAGEYTIACKVQDNLGGETIFTYKTVITK